MNPEELLKLVEALNGSKKDKCCTSCECPIKDQYEHSLARFNDSSAQTSAASQQAFAQAMSVHAAHLLKIQADITRVDFPTT